MKVIIKKTGQIKEVSDGYARNYLIPNGLAELATERAVAEQQKQEKINAVQSAQQRERQQTMRSELQALTVTLTAAANAEGKLFGALTRDDLLNALHDAGMTVAKREWIEEVHIKTTGTHDVRVHIPGSDPIIIPVHVHPAS